MLTAQQLLFCIPTIWGLASLAQLAQLLNSSQGLANWLPRSASIIALGCGGAALALEMSGWRQEIELLQQGQAQLPLSSLSLIALLAILWNALHRWWESASEDQGNQETVWAEMLALAAACLSLVTDQIWLVLAGLSASQTVWLIEQNRRSEASNATGSQAALIVGACGDLAWIVGLVVLQSIGVSTSLSALNAVEVYDGLDSFDRAYWSLAVCWLLAGLALRSALFPFVFWLKGVAAHDRQAAWLTGMLLPLAGWTVLRLSPVLFRPEGVTFSVIGYGLLSAVLAGILAGGQAQRSQMLAYAGAAKQGLLWATLAIPGVAVGQFASLLLVGTLVVPAIANCRGSKTSAYVAVGGIALLLGSGLWGEQTAWSLARTKIIASQAASIEVAEAPAEAGVEAPPPQIPAATIWLYPLAMTLSVFALSRAALSSETATAKADGQGSGVAWLAISLLLAGAGGLAVIGLSAGSQWMTMPSPGICSVAAIGAAAVIVSRRLNPNGATSTEESSLARLIRQDFYAERTLKLIAVPVFRVMVRTGRFLDSLVIERLVFGLPRRTTKVLQEWSQALEEDQQDRRGWLAVLAVLVLIAGIWLGS